MTKVCACALQGWLTVPEGELDNTVTFTLFYVNDLENFKIVFLLNYWLYLF